MSEGQQGTQSRTMELGYSKQKQLKKKKLSHSSWIKKLDVVFNRYIRERDNNICYCCGSTTQPQAGHFIPKSVTGLELRYNEKNVHCQCVRCNKWLGGNLSVYSVKLEEQYGYGILQELAFYRKVISKWTDEDFQKKYDHYKGLLV